MNAAPTKHDESVASVSLDQSAPRHLRTVEQGELYFELFRNWITGLLQTAGHDIFRMKGVVNVAHAKRRFVYHAVHMSFEGSFEDEWAEDEPRASRLVFIARSSLKVSRPADSSSDDTDIITNGLGPMDSTDDPLP